MKVEVVMTDLIRLQPENDADEALLDMWSEQTCYMASSAHHCGPSGLRTTSVHIGFKEIDRCLRNRLPPYV